MNDERRSAPRKPTTAPIEVVDTISGENIGRVGNLSRNGMMLRMCIMISVWKWKGY